MNLQSCILDTNIVITPILVIPFFGINLLLSSGFDKELNTIYINHQKFC
jgi:hypothetical protein